MRFRRTAAAGVAVLALGGLSACQTNVGTAAWVDGHRITESDVNRYLSARAQPLTGNSAGSQVAPRAVVLQELIYERQYLRALQKLVGKRAPTFAQLDASADRELGQGATRSITQQVRSKGYSLSLVPIVLRVLEMSDLLRRLGQAGFNVSKTLRDLDFPVSVNPRYGSWNARTATFDDHVVIPGYLTPQVGGVPNQ